MKTLGSKRRVFLCRRFFSCVLLVGITAGILSAISCGNEPIEGAITSASDAQVETTEFAHSANATIAALQTAQVNIAETHQRASAVADVINTPKASIDTDEPDDLGAIPDEASSPAKSLPAPATALVDIATSSISDPVDLPPLNRTRPKDVLSEVKYFPAGGGGVTDCRPHYYPGDWSGHPREVVWTSPPEAEWLDILTVHTCGWVPNEKTILAVSSQNVIVMVNEIEADEWGSVFVDFLIEMGHVPGPYHFSFTGKDSSDEITADFLVKFPAEPTLYHFFDAKKNDTKEMLFQGFRPDERVRLIVYQGRNGQYPFVGWTEVQVNENGQLITSSSLKGTDVEPVFYVAIGDKSGEARSMRRDPIYGLFRGVSRGIYTPATNESCPQEQSTRLALGMQARVTANRLRVREGPGTNHPTVFGTSVDNGRILTILDGPVCAEGFVWWKAETGTITLTNGQKHNIVGWVAEQSEGEWFLEPIQ